MVHHVTGDGIWGAGLKFTRVSFTSLVRSCSYASGITDVMWYRPEAVTCDFVIPVHSADSARWYHLIPLL